MIVVYRGPGIDGPAYFPFFDEIPHLVTKDVNYRIIGEYEDGKIDAISKFCGASTGKPEEYVKDKLREIAVERKASLA